MKTREKNKTHFDVIWLVAVRCTVPCVFVPNADTECKIIKHQQQIQRNVGFRVDQKHER